LIDIAPYRVASGEIKASSEGIRKGDQPSHPLELIVRRVHSGNEFREETVLRIGHTDSLDEAKLRTATQRRPTEAPQGREADSRTETQRTGKANTKTAIARCARS